MTTPRRRWFQFSIREILLGVTAIGFALAWAGERKAAAPIRMGVEYLRSVSPTSVYGEAVVIEGVDAGFPIDVTVSRHREPSANEPVYFHAPAVHRLPLPTSATAAKP